MAKTRVYELARELDVQPKELLDMLKTIGVSGKVPSSSIEDTAAQALRQMVDRKNNPQAAVEAKPAPAPVKPTSFKKFKVGDFRARAQSLAGERPPGERPATTDSSTANGAAGSPQSGEAEPTRAKPPASPSSMPPRSAPPARETQRPAAQAPVASTPAARASSPKPTPAAQPTPVARGAVNGATTSGAATQTPVRPSAPTQSTPPALSTPSAPARPATQVRPTTGRVENRDGSRTGSGTTETAGPAADTAPAAGTTSPGAPVSGAPAPTSGAPSAPRPARPAPSGRFARARSIGRGSSGGRRGRRSHPGRDDREGPRFGDRDFTPEEYGIQKVAKTQEGEKPVLVIPPTITVSELAAMIEQPSATLIKELFAMSIIRSANQPIESDVAGQLLAKFGYGVELASSRSDASIAEEDESDLVDVPPVVTIMGHVDHGKTSLLDIIRSANVQSGEAGGITQRIGAYETEHNGERIVFLDTPGHEAFTRMRARGAHVTDIAILVVAADDGVMPQTREAIDHARAAKVPIIVAMNKMDRAEADPNRVKGELAEVGLIPEDYGGDIVVIPVSAITGQGVQDLLDMVLLVAELQELKGHEKGLAQGTIIEARQDTQKGPVATVLLHRGTLNQGDHVVVGDVYGRVRNLTNYKGDELKSAGPKTPVSITGLSAVPHASDLLEAVPSSRLARERAEQFAQDAKEGRHIGTGRVSLNELFAQIQQGNLKDLNVVVKADGQGSVEALCQNLEKQKNEEVRVRIISRGVGNINESDIMLASASNAIVIAFAVGADVVATSLADREGVEIRKYDVIYDALNEVKAALEGMLEPVFEEKLSGEAEVRALFKSSRAGTIAGCMVTSGKIVAGSKLVLMRGPKRDIVFEGKLDSLRHIKQSVKEVTAGSECGVSAQNFNDFQEGDIVQSIIQVQIKRTL